jgi:putative transposase
VFTTRGDATVSRTPDLVHRSFSDCRPDALWVTDLTYVVTRSGMAHICFIVDTFPEMIVSWRVGTHMVLDAIKMVHRSRGAGHLGGLVAHSDTGAQGGFNRSTQHCLLQESVGQPLGPLLVHDSGPWPIAY